MLSIWSAGRILNCALPDRGRGSAGGRPVIKGRIIASSGQVGTWPPFRRFQNGIPCEVVTEAIESGVPRGNVETVGGIFERQALA